jgi:hypothetical protein
MLKRSRANVQPRHRRFDRLSPHQHLHRIWALRVGDLVGGRADRAAAQQVECAVVGDPEQPGAQWRKLLQFVHGEEGRARAAVHAPWHRFHRPVSEDCRCARQRAGAVMRALDGEAIVVNQDGLSVFDLIRHRHHDNAAVLCAFDLIELDG